MELLYFYRRSCVLRVCSKELLLNVFISDPQPAFQLLNYTVSVQENGPPVQLVLNISVRAGSKDKTHANMVFKIISGSHTFVNIVHQ